MSDQSEKPKAEKRELRVYKNVLAVGPDGYSMELLQERHQGDMTHYNPDLHEYPTTPAGEWDLVYLIYTSGRDTRGIMQSLNQSARIILVDFLAADWVILNNPGREIYAINTVVPLTCLE